ncbi:MAG: lamin tail domain-containing protein, partial [Patescibacteria group bacterium]
VLTAAEAISEDSSDSLMAPAGMNDCTLPAEEDSEELPDSPLIPPITSPPASIVPEEAADAPSGLVFPSRDVGLASPHISELLPNPAKPLTDAADEFVELYNSNDAPFELSGFILEVGKKRYVFAQGTLLAARSFKAFFSADTRLALSNTQGQARLLDPFGRVIAQTEPYQTAKDGQSWALAEGTWHWTTAPTPNAANTIKAPATKKKAAAKTAGSKTDAVKSASATTSQTTAEKNTAASTTADQPRSPLHPGVLALVAIFALLYGAYEYRRDVANKFYQFRAYRAARREARQELKGR